MLKEYLTVGRLGKYEFVQKKSKFIATVKHVSSVDFANEFIESTSKKYSDASHNVYAYSVDRPNFLQKYSDAGEPGGTAGLPTMEAIKRNNIRNVCVIITRYFGGILLGASGLIRAYGKCAAKGIEEAGIVKMAPHLHVSFVIEYQNYGKIENYIEVNNLKKGEVDFSNDIELNLYLPLNKVDDIIGNIKDITNGSVLISKKDAQYRAMNI